MQLYLVSPVFFAVMAICALGGLHRLLMFLCAMIPFGMLAVIGLPAVGGLSLLAANMAAAVFVSAGCLVLVSRLVRGEAVGIAPASVAILAFAAYAVFSATVLVRLFAGETMVFALSRGAIGVKVSTQFSWGKVWLGPSSSNISQTFYVLLASGFFIVACHVLTRHGPAFGVRCLALAATVNLFLGLLDLAALDSLLVVVRTASYSLANEASVRGIPRLIGGFSEAASFGSASAMFFGYFGSAWARSRRIRDGALALGNGSFALMALSSTGLLAMAVVIGIITPRLISNWPTQLQRRHLLLLAVLLAGGAIALAAALILTEAPAIAASIIDDLILGKSGTSSGAERTAWAMGGLEALRDTWGLGAGTGSLRSNGLLFVLLGSVGIVGTAFFMMFLWLAFAGRAAPGQEGTLSDARIAALAVIVSMALAATVPDPGIPLILLAALSVSAKQTRRRYPTVTPISRIGPVGHGAKQVP